MVDVSTLESVPFERLDDLPHKPCVYVALANDSVLYIGSTGSLLKRLMSHHRLKDFLEHKCSRIAWAEVETENLRSTEKEWIASLKPLLNWKQRQVERLVRDSERSMLSIVMRCWRQSADLSVYGMARELDIRAREVIAIEYDKQIGLGSLSKVLTWLLTDEKPLTNGTKERSR